MEKLFSPSNLEFQSEYLFIGLTIYHHCSSVQSKKVLENWNEIRHYVWFGFGKLGQPCVNRIDAFVAAHMWFGNLLIAPQVHTLPQSWIILNYAVECAWHSIDEAFIPIHILFDPIGFEISHELASHNPSLQSSKWTAEKLFWECLLMGRTGVGPDHQRIHKIIIFRRPNIGKYTYWHLYHT